MRRNRTLPRLSNATKRLPIVLRSCLAPQPRPRTTIAEALFAPEPPSAAELAAGDFLRPHLPSAHREDRPGLAGPSLPSGALEEPPFVDGDRRRPATVRAERKEGEGDQSNLTSGPSGPTVSDPRGRSPLYK